MGVVRLLESGCAAIVGTVDRSGAPEATRAWGIDVAPGGARVRLLLAAAATVTLENVEATRVIAVTATDVETLRSVQMKGSTLTCEPATARDDARAQRFVDEFAAAIAARDGTPTTLVRRLVPARFVVVDMAVAEMFDQTPGPSAGTSLVRPGA